MNNGRAKIIIETVLGAEVSEDKAAQILAWIQIESASKLDEDVSVFYSRMEELANEKDYEKAHDLADNILCDILLKCGFYYLVENYKKIKRWHA